MNCYLQFWRTTTMMWQARYFCVLSVAFDIPLSGAVHDMKMFSAPPGLVGFVAASPATTQAVIVVGLNHSAALTHSSYARLPTQTTRKMNCSAAAQFVAVVVTALQFSIPAWMASVAARGREGVSRRLCAVKRGQHVLLPTTF